MEKTLKSRFQCNGKGFHLTFENGNVFSVQFGTRNYCDAQGKDQAEGQAGSQTAEIAVYKRSKCSNRRCGGSYIEWHHWDFGGPWGHFLTYDGQTEIGHLTTDQVLKAMVFVSQLDDLRPHPGRTDPDHPEPEKEISCENL